VTGAVYFPKKSLDFIHFEFSILLPVFRNSSSQNQKKPVHVWNESSYASPLSFLCLPIKENNSGKKGMRFVWKVGEKL
jgi:hypothetical protein